MKKIAILVSVLAIVAIVGLIGKYILLDRGPLPEQSEYQVDLDEVRALVQAESDELPIRLNSVAIAEGEFPRWAVVAGALSQPYPMNIVSFQVVYDDKTVVIDASYGKAEVEKLPFGATFHEERFAAMQQAMQQAEQIVVTHEHGDHIGGIAQSPVLEQIWPKVLLTKEQIHGPAMKDSHFPDGLLETAVPLEYDAYHRLAPGIVLIKASGHTPGHQMVYVQLQSGEEFLLIGDVIWNEANLKCQAARPLLVSLILRQDRRQTTHQIRWLHDEVYQNPQEKIHLVISHDPEQRRQHIQQGLLGDAFEL